MSAIISPCGTWRLRLDRSIKSPKGQLVFAFFGVNPSTDDGDISDATSRKWYGFTERNGGCRYIAGNPFAYRSTDVKKLSSVAEPVGPENGTYLARIIQEADVLVPCWGNRSKVPKHLRFHLDRLMYQLMNSGKPVKVFGITKSGDPMHPLMLGYDTPLVDIRSLEK